MYCFDIVFMNMIVVRSMTEEENGEAHRGRGEHKAEKMIIIDTYKYTRYAERKHHHEPAITAKMLPKRRGDHN